MATVLIIEDVPHVAPRLADSLARRGHHVVRCAGGLTPYAACPMLRGESCILPDAAHVIVFACTASVPFFGRTYRAEHLLAAYCGHERYGRMPILMVGPPDTEFAQVGRRARIAVDASADEYVDAIARLLETPEQPHREHPSGRPRRQLTRLAPPRSMRPRQREART